MSKEQIEETTEFVNDDEAQVNEDVEDAVMRIMTNEPSEAIEVMKSALVFQRPSLPSKYKQRAWAKRKIKEFGLDETPNSDESYLFQQWGTLNSFVKHIYVSDKKGKVKLNGNTYTEFTYDPKVDLDYGSAFEKYVMEEVYNRGISEEAYLMDAFGAFIEWLNEAVVPAGDDIKNS